MKKLVKKILTTVCTLVLCLVCLTGCSWLEINKGDYYKQLVVTIGNESAGNKMEFTKKDLVDAFSLYGYQYYQQYGYSMEDSIKETINNMIDRELLMQEVQKTISLSGPEKLEIRKQAFDQMQEAINSFEVKVRKEWKMEIVEDIATPADPMRKAEEEYVNVITYDNGVVSRAEEKEDSIYVSDDLPEYFTKEYKYRVVTDEKVANEAWTRYIKSLQDLAKSEGRSIAEKDVLKEEQKRLEDLITINTYLDKYEKAFLARTPIDVEAVVRYYKEQYAAQRTKFLANEDAYHTAMKNASSDYIYYHANSGEEYVNVKHILMNFSDEQKAEIATLNKRYGIADDNTEADEKKKLNSEYQTELKRITSRTKTTFEMSEDMYKETNAQNYNFIKVEGKKNTYTAYASDVYAYVQANAYRNSAMFDDLVYVFNDDEGFMNSAFDYVVNIDTNITDQMVKPFANGVRALHKDKTKGEGSMDMIVSTYGYHIIFHDGVAHNILDEANIKNMNSEAIIDVLCSNTTTPDSNKTIFEYIYEKLQIDNNLYNNMTQKVVADARTQLKANDYVITYYEKNYKDLFE